ncbi:MAG: protoglobin family protein [Candidatus Rokubacteria bacterium]|nr:protoglobin family protein [Candidatus Rokubacteria bacterium]
MATYLPGADMERFLKEQLAFVGFTDDDAATIRRSAPLVLAREAELTTALYDHFLSMPDSARFFLGPDGEPDQVRLQRRKHSLARWLKETAAAAVTQEFSYYVLMIGLSHSHRPAGPDRPGGTVPARMMVGAMSLTQSALAGVFAAALPPAEALAASVSWNKILLVHLNALLLGYLPKEHR